MIEKEKCDFLMKCGCCAIADVASFMSLPDENFSTIKYIACEKNKNCYFKQRRKYKRFIQKMYAQLLRLIQNANLINNRYYISTDTVKSSIEPYIRSFLYKNKDV